MSLEHTRTTAQKPRGLWARAVALSAAVATALAFAVFSAPAAYAAPATPLATATDWQSAMAAANASDTVNAKLANDLSVTGPAVLSAGTLIIDLNGFSLTVAPTTAGAAGFEVKPGALLHLTSSVPGAPPVGGTFTFVGADGADGADGAGSPPMGAHGAVGADGTSASPDGEAGGAGGAGENGATGEDGLDGGAGFINDGAFILTGSISGALFGGNGGAGGAGGAGADGGDGGQGGNGWPLKPDEVAGNGGAGGNGGTAGAGGDGGNGGDGGPALTYGGVFASQPNIGSAETEGEGGAQGVGGSAGSPGAGGAGGIAGSGDEGTTDGAAGADGADSSPGNDGVPGIKPNSLNTKGYAFFIDDSFDVQMPTTGLITSCGVTLGEYTALLNRADTDFPSRSGYTFAGWAAIPDSVFVDPDGLNGFNPTAEDASPMSTPICTEEEGFWKAAWTKEIPSDDQTTGDEVAGDETTNDEVPAEEVDDEVPAEKVDDEPLAKTGASFDAAWLGGGALLLTVAGAGVFAMRRLHKA